MDEVFVWTNRPVWPQGIPVPKSDGSPTPEGLDWDLWLVLLPRLTILMHTIPLIGGAGGHMERGFR